MEKTLQFTVEVAKKYPKFKVTELQGRYITYSDIEPVIDNLKKNFSVTEIGKSTLGTSIPKLVFGKGETKILAWSQMHGNESTTTKAIFDLLNLFYLFRDHQIVKILENKITLWVIPMLNPDGAYSYTRVNANNVDLNRDAKDRSQVESQVLRQIFDIFSPNFCFNLHDQRTIFSAGNVSLPATVSFLTPALDEERRVTSSREESMKVIVAMNEFLQSVIPGQVGRYDDAYNLNCTGDTFQTLKVPTVLFEAGHFQNDYQREKTRELILNSLVCAIVSISTGEVKNLDYKRYFEIPGNEKLFYDVILRDALINDEIVDVAIQYKEVREKGKIAFTPTIEKIGKNLSFYGHQELNCKKKELQKVDKEAPSENDIVSKLLLNNEVLFINYANN